MACFSLTPSPRVHLPHTGHACPLLALLLALPWLGLGLGVGRDAAAQAFPSKSLRIVVPFPPGGTSDILSRSIGARLAEEWGQPVITDNRPGAAGNIASELVAKSKGDGYTLYINTVGTHAINPTLYPKLPFDVLRDFTPITNLVWLPSLLMVHPSLPVRNARELIALAKKRPGQLFYSSAGSGSQPHLNAEMFSTMAGIQWVHVPHKGAAQQMTDLLGGHVMVTFATAPGGMPFVKSGQLRAIAVTGTRRIPALPDTPTVAESALPDYNGMGWNGLVGPAGMPPAVLERIHSAVVRIVQAPEMREKLIGLGADPVTTTPEEFGAFMKAEIGRWASVVKASGAKVD
jgi:tripartite-type tricarboxylate transporter receptor subunit TctC